MVVGGGEWWWVVVVGGHGRPREATGGHRGKFPRTDFGMFRKSSPLPTPPGSRKLGSFTEKNTFIHCHFHIEVASCMEFGGRFRYGVLLRYETNSINGVEFSPHPLQQMRTTTTSNKQHYNISCFGSTVPQAPFSQTGVALGVLAALLDD